MNKIFLKEQLELKKKMLGDKAASQLLFPRLDKSLRFISENDHEKLEELKVIIEKIPSGLPIDENTIRLLQNHVLSFLASVRASYKLIPPFFYFSRFLGIGTFVGVLVKIIFDYSLHWLIIGICTGMLVGTLLDEWAKRANKVL